MNAPRQHDQRPVSAVATLAASRRQALERRVARAMRKIPRRLFVPPRADGDVPDNEAVSLGEHCVVPPTEVVSVMLGALNLEGNERVLEIGTGSGYQAALLGALAREVYSIEIDGQLARGAAERLALLGVGNVHVLQGDASAGWPE